MGRKCAVPHCYIGYRKCVDKAALYKVPDDDFFLSKWNEAIAREDRPITPKDYVCEKHFKDDDILRKRIIKDVEEVYQRPRLKPDAIPSVFPDFPEFILKMTKKRRRTDIPVFDNNLKVQDNVFIKKEPEEIKTEICEKDEQTCIYNDEINIKTEVIKTEDVRDEDEYDSTGVKIYKCNECDYKSKFAHNIKTHQIKHQSGDEAYINCEFCTDYKTKWETTYLNHMKHKHNIFLKDFYKCPLCSFKTKSKNFLSKHCEYQHKNDTNTENQFKCEVDGCLYQTYSKTLLGIHDLTHNKHNHNSGNNYDCDIYNNSIKEVPDQLVLEKPQVQDFCLITIKQEHES